MHGLDILATVVLLLASGFAVILISRLLRVSPVVGFLLAGVALGPHGLDLIAETELTKILAELGVVFLLFDIGLHFSMKSLWSRRGDLLGFGPLQMLLCGLATGLVLMYAFGVSAEMAILAGLTLALSSTAVVMQVLGDLKQKEAPVGQSAKSVLIFQDIAAIFLLIFADSIGGNTELGTLVLGALTKTAIAVAASVVLGQFILAPLMRSIIKYDDPEMFTILGLLIVMMTGLATAWMDLSLTLGAFLAGMVLADTPFRIMLQTELRPFRSLLLALFFITVGMVIEPAEIMGNAGEVIGLLALLLLVKAALIFGIMTAFRRPRHHIVQLSILLAQGSEFAFVIFSMSNVQTAIGPVLTQQMIAAVALSMLLTPLLSQLANRWSLKICAALESVISNCPEGEQSPALQQPVFIVGINEIGKTIARGLRAHDIPYIAIDRDRQRFLEATAAGYIVAYGHTSDLRFWNTLGVSKARAMCLAAPSYEVARDVAPVIAKLYPNLKRYAAVSDSADGVRFAGLGLIPYHNRGAPPGLEMACAVLKEFGVAEKSIEDWSKDEHYTYLESHPPVNVEPVPPTAAQL